MADTKSPPEKTKVKAKPPSPFLVQYLGIKARHPDALLFFRMGDFYELFFDDAVKAADILGITLTARGEYEGKPIPMAGVPFHAAEGYLARLIKSGARVAVCEQTETPAEAKKRGSKSIVNRDIVRIVTPGTITEDALLSARQGQALAAVALGAGGTEAAIAVCDVSTGRFDMMSVDPVNLADALMSWPLSELLVTDADLERPLVTQACALSPAPVTVRPKRSSAPKTGEALLKDAFQVGAVDAFGAFSKAEFSAMGVLLDYVSLVQAGADIRLDPPQRVTGEGYLAIDPATRTSLEIDRAMNGGRAGSLLHCVDRTVTALGARLLAARLSRPSIDRSDIESRLDAVAWIKDDRDVLDGVRARLKAAPDLERARTRLRLGRGGPRDLAAIGRALVAGQQASADLMRAGGAMPARLADAASVLSLANHPELASLASDLERAIAESPPLLAREGGFVAAGWDAALDEARALRDNGRKIIAELQARYATETGVSALKIKFNNVLGYFVDVPAKHGDAMMKAPLSDTFIHRQTLAGNVRFSSQELSELAAKISRAEEVAKGCELGVYEVFVGRTEAANTELTAAADAIAEIDVAASHAAWANEADGVRPVLTDAPVFDAEGLRHPVVEAALAKEGKGFTANNLSLDAGGEAAPRLTLITGPNMAGKSTYLRQAALAVVLAQAGGFVPARALTLGIADRVFSRVGASDDLARGRSTFMVEMVETASILSQATGKSFVILDEVGRGTSTWDGLAIAWAAVEHLHDVNGARALFATHYHELTELAETLPHASNACLRAKEWKDDLVFLHEVQAGPADRSYGVQVAKLAGLPRKAVQRAAQILKRLESTPSTAETLPLFAAMPAEMPDIADTAPHPVVTQLDGIDPDTLSPREALDLIYALKKTVRED